ncbi:MAG TPA: RNase adapter RapZ, partial [Verrucomicrobiae bacterium]|nr:RNase adapter RapZ [Verrucomicrobiae bacterium]
MSAPRKLQRGGRVKSRPRQSATHLVVITGMSGSGKASVLKAFEDLDYYCVDNLPIDLIPRFADLAKQSAEIEKAALVADIREGEQLKRLPRIIQSLRKQIKTTVL